jgi:hypothetical protein
MSKKPTGFEAVARKPRAPDAEPIPIAAQVKHKRANAGPKRIPIRFEHAEWERVHSLAMSENVSVQGLVVYALSRLFEERGLPKL